MRRRPLNRSVVDQSSSLTRITPPRAGLRHDGAERGDPSSVVLGGDDDVGGGEGRIACHGDVHGRLVQVRLRVLHREQIALGIRRRQDVRDGDGDARSGFHDEGVPVP